MLYLGKTGPNTRSYHRGSNPGTSEHKAVTLANTLRRSPYLLTFSLSLPCHQYCIITKHDRLRPEVRAKVCRCIILAVNYIVINGTADQSSEYADDFQTMEHIKLMNYLNLREGVRLSAQFIWFCKVGSQNFILFIYTLTAETFIKTKVFIYQVE